MVAVAEVVSASPALARLADEAAGGVALGEDAGELRVAAGAIGVERDEDLFGNRFMHDVILLGVFNDLFDFDLVVRAWRWGLSGGAPGKATLQLTADS